MKTTTLQQSEQQSELKSVPQSIAPTASQQTGLVARWHTIDGKLVCQWTTAAPSRSSNLLSIIDRVPQAA
jgi:hypothetical protein